MPPSIEQGPAVEDLPYGREPLPSTGLLAVAWRTNFENLGAFLPLVCIEMLVVGAVIGAQLAYVFSSGIPQRPSQYTDAQWFLSVGVGAAVSCLFVFPFSACIYKVCFNVFERSPAPLEGLRVFAKHYVPCFVLGFCVTALTTVAEFFVRKNAGGAASFVNAIIGTLINFPVLLVIPAMVRMELPLGKAVQYSIRRISENPLAMLGYYIGASILAVSGVIACCVGIIVTACLHQIALALLMPGFDFNRPPVNPESPYPR